MGVVSNEKISAKQIINCAAYSMGRRVADVEFEPCPRSPERSQSICVDRLARAI
jgi:hypothetical protein